MNKTRAFISAARLRTLPLSLSGIIVGSAIAASQGFFNLQILIFSLLTTIGFQVLSNFANDYGDGVKGTDNEDRVGPVRALQSGAISDAEMKKAMIICGLLSMFSALYLIYLAFGKDNLLLSILFFALGLAAIGAAVKYTVGDSAYGYRGLGDLFVFLFFGLLSVAGCYFLYTHKLEWDVFLPACTIGFLSTGVLNLNNMRDYESDKKAGKNTLVVKMGERKARNYHYVLILLAMLFGIWYLWRHFNSAFNLIFLISYIPIGFHLVRVFRNKDLRTLDPELKKLAISTFLFSILFWVSFNIFL